jgi:hypothetical protein
MIFSELASAFRNHAAKAKAAEPEFDRLTRSEISRKPKLTARPQYEAHAHVIYFDFFLAFFFFVAMTLFP